MWFWTWLTCCKILVGTEPLKDIITLERAECTVHQNQWCYLKEKFEEIGLIHFNKGALTFCDLIKVTEFWKRWIKLILINSSVHFRSPYEEKMILKLGNEWIEIKLRYKHFIHSLGYIANKIVRAVGWCMSVGEMSTGGGGAAELWRIEAIAYYGRTL